MANTRFQHKRSSVSGVVPTTVQIATGELGINLADRKLFTSNGTAVFELGSNLTSLSVSGNVVITGSANAANVTAALFTGNVTGTASNATNLNSQPGSFYTNATNIDTGTLPDARLSSAVVNTTGTFTLTGIRTHQSNVVIGNTTVNTQHSNATILISNSTSTTTIGLTDLRIGNTTTNVIISNTVSSFGGNVGIGNTAPDARLTVTGTANISGNVVVGGRLSDSIGNVRDIPIFSQTISYTIANTDAGETISTNSSITVNGAILYTNFVVSVFNNSTANITITAGTNTTIYLAGTSTVGNRTLAQRGICTIYCVAANTFVISGAGLT